MGQQDNHLLTPRPPVKPYRQKQEAPVKITKTKIKKFSLKDIFSREQATILRKITLMIKPYNVRLKFSTTKVGKTMHRQTSPARALAFMLISAALTITNNATLLPKAKAAGSGQNPACKIWPQVSHVATIPEIEAFLTVCTEGFYHGMAKARISELKGETNRTKAPPKPETATREERHEPADDLYRRAKNYQRGDGGKPKDYEKSLALFKQAAAKGHKKSMTDIGWMNENGFGTPKNIKRAFEWYKKAADLGEAMALNNLGWMYTQGKATKIDYKKAVRLYRRAVALGEPLAMTNLGWMYETGKGVETDVNQAYAYYKRAADAGDLQGLHNTGWMLAAGLGVARDAKKGAAAVYSSLRKGNKFSKDQMTTNYDTWPKEFRKEMQKILKREGFYNGKTNGDFDALTIAAVERASN